MSGQRWYTRPEVVIFSPLLLVGGIALGVYVLPPQWALWARAFAGVALGLAAILSFFANRMIGNTDFD